MTTSTKTKTKTDATADAADQAAKPSPGERSRQRLAQAKANYDQFNAELAKAKKLIQGPLPLTFEGIKEVAIARAAEDLLDIQSAQVKRQLRLAQEGLRTDVADVAEALAPHVREVLDARISVSTSIEPAPSSAQHDGLDVPYVVLHQIRPSKLSPGGDGELQSEVTLVLHRDKKLHAEQDLDKLASALNNRDGVHIHPERHGTTDSITMRVSVLPSE